MAKRSRLQTVACSSSNGAFPSEINEEIAIFFTHDQYPQLYIILDLSIAVFKFTGLEVPQNFSLVARPINLQEGRKECRCPGKE
jgi:hypothetical protein